jgi:hypothetical protein
MYFRSPHSQNFAYGWYVFLDISQSVKYLDSKLEKMQLLHVFMNFLIQNHHFCMELVQNCVKEHHNVYSSPNIIRIIESNRMRWVAHSVHGEVRNAYKILAG